MALLTSASVAVDELSNRFHTILIVCGHMQFVFFVGVVVRGKCIGHCCTVSVLTLLEWLQAEIVQLDQIERAQHGASPCASPFRSIRGRR